jgi:branched-subunit amino acid transport protein
VNIWLIMLVGGLITFGMRYSFIFLFGKFEIPETMRKALHYVPPAVLSAITVPALVYQTNHLDLSLANTQLLAGIVAILVAWYTKNTLLTILAGMVALLLLQLFIGT